MHSPAFGGGTVRKDLVHPLDPDRRGTAADEDQRLRARFLENGRLASAGAGLARKTYS
jgi:hypothetical protein